jgi:hypothetical protein
LKRERERKRRKRKEKKEIGRGATPGFLKRSPILVLLSRPVT